MALVTATDGLAAGTTTSAVSGASTQLIGANTERNGLRVSVDPAGAAAVYLLLGTGTASATAFHVALAAGAFWDGLIGHAVWRGAVQVFGTGARVSVVEA